MDKADRKDLEAHYEDPRDWYDIPESECPHDRTVLINEEGHAGEYCVDCGEKLREE